MSIPNNTHPPSTLISTIRENVENFTNKVYKNNSGCDENDITIAEKTVINGITVFIGNDGTHYDPLIHEIILKIISLKQTINGNNVSISSSVVEELSTTVDNITLTFSKYYSWFELIHPDHFQKYIHKCVNKNYKETCASLILLTRWLEDLNPDKPCLLTETVSIKHGYNDIDTIIDNVLSCLKTHNAHVSYNNVTHTKYKTDTTATDIN
jgi:hypothetical protein